MTTEQAKDILRMWRPGGQDVNNPKFAKALQMVERDPALARWFAEQKAFDASMAASLQAVRVPVSLRASILAQGPQPQPTEPLHWHFPWWQMPAVRWSLAAGLLILVAFAGFWINRPPRTFADYRNEVIESAWGSAPHMEMEASDLPHIKNWLVQQGVDAEFNVPIALADMPLRGCRVLEWHGRKTALICFADGLKHRHLFIMDHVSFPDLPGQNTPDFENCGGWKTVSWAQGAKTYVLAGMNYWTFVKKFRKGGHWLIAS